VRRWPFYPFRAKRWRFLRRWELRRLDFRTRYMEMIYADAERTDRDISFLRDQVRKRLMFADPKNRWSRS
jgi:hypothetical protein